MPGKVRARSFSRSFRLVVTGAVVGGLVASCGRSTRREAPVETGAGAASGGSSDARSGGGAGGASGGATAGVSASGGLGAEGGLAAGQGRGGDAVGGASDGGASAGAPEGGMGGSDECVDVCALGGESCCDTELGCVKPGNGCTFEVLGATLGTIYEYDALVAAIAQLPQDVVLSLTDADVERAAVDPAPASRMRLLLTAEAAAAHGAALDGAQYRHPFRLTCQGELVYWGLTYDVGGAAALRYPVLDVARDATTGQVSLQLGSYQGAWLFGPDDDDALAARFESAPLRAAFCARGVLSGLDADARPLP